MSGGRGGVFFHGLARAQPPDFQVKGEAALTEHYSMLGPEVIEGPTATRSATGTPSSSRSCWASTPSSAGQAKSHCLAWTIDDLLKDDDVRERGLAERTYLLEDCTSPVVVPGVVDYTDEADAAFERYGRRHARRPLDRPDRELAGVQDRRTRA